MQDFEEPASEPLADPIAEPSRPKRITRKREPWEPTNWQKVVTAVETLGGARSRAEILAFVKNRDPGFVEANLEPDLSAVSVNSHSRGNHGVNFSARRTDSGSRFDRLVRIGSGRDVRYALYDPSIHGVWELRDVGEKRLRPVKIENGDEVELRRAREQVTEDGSFDPTPDQRARTMAEIVRREGQPAFRRALLEAYAGECVLSGCKVEPLLEAAHIAPYRGKHTNVVGNGLLLRADLHKLFDLHLVGIDPETRSVNLHESLLSSEYATFSGRRLRTPTTASAEPIRAALLHHWNGWLAASA